MLGEQVLHRRPIEFAVGLGAGPAHGRALGQVEGAELDAGPVDGPAHDAVQGVDLADQVALAQTADGRIARHLADRLDPMGQKQGAGAQARGRRRGFTAGMAAAHYDHVI